MLLVWDPRKHVQARCPEGVGGSGTKVRRSLSPKHGGGEEGGVAKRAKKIHLNLGVEAPAPFYSRAAREPTERKVKKVKRRLPQEPRRTFRREAGKKVKKKPRKVN